MLPVKPVLRSLALSDAVQSRRCHVRRSAVALPPGAVGACGEPVEPPDGASVRYSIRLLQCDCADDAGTEGRIAVARCRLERAAELFRAREYAAALELYGGAILMVGACADDEAAVNASTSLYQNSSAGAKLRCVQGCACQRTCVCIS